jgi:eukaryotic-like serine/threonine-protein kinase
VISPGARLGPYEILSALGAGGMGEVYRARDTRLNRTVALKVLPPALADDAQFRVRFEREGQAIAALAHPHICAVHDVGHEDGIQYLVLEYLDGETLSARLERGALSLDHALACAIQMADALDAAHRRGIVHRDLKPGNIMLVRSGGASAPPSAKLLDFGLAKTSAPVISTSGLSMLPTTPPALTAQGTILGTIQYMAPEQIEGLEADARTDIFAFGAVLFEMLTGRPAFEGKTRAQLLGAILKDEPPPVSTLQPRVPKALDRMVSTCLAKDPDDRWQTARELLRELRWASDSGTENAATSAGASPAHGGRYIRRTGVAWAVAAGLGIALVAASVVLVRHFRENAPLADVLQFSIPIPENAQLAGPPGGGTGGAAQLAVSPDGRQVAFVAVAQNAFTLWLRPISTLAARQIPGTEGASFPFWSPDSRSVGFFAGGKLKKVQASGGPPTILCDAPAGRGGTWSRENVIVFSPDATSGLQRVSGAGGVPVAVTVLDTTYGETSHRWPSFLPDGRHFLYTGSVGPCCPATKAGRIKIAALDTKETVTLLQADSSSVYASGHVLFTREGTLMAQPFDVGSHRLASDAFPVAERVAAEGSRYGSFSVSESGVLGYVHGAITGSAQLTWLDRTGKTLGTLGDPGTYMSVALSPDERRVAVGVMGGTPRNADIWTIDVGRGISSRLTFDPANEGFAVWSPDSARVAFDRASSEPSLRAKLASGTVTDEPLLTLAKEATSPLLDDWSSDGRFIAYDINMGSGLEVWILPLAGDRKPFPVVQGPRSHNRAAFAPDAHWIAYCSDESGLSQVYVQPFPATGGRFQVSKEGGIQPLWRGDGKELFFLALDGTLMAAPIETKPEFQSASPQALFSSRSITITSGSTGRRQYAVTRDGKRFLVITSERSLSGSPLTIVVNWLAAVQK